MEEIPDEEKVAIATHYLMSSPPAEVREVLADVKVVLNPPTLLTDGVLKGIFRKYNTQNYEVVDADGTQVVLSEHAELDAKHYVSAKGEVFSVDHVSQKATKAGAEAPEWQPGPNESARAAIQQQMEEYVAVQYIGGSAFVAAHESDGQVIVTLSGSKANLRNFWSGKWRSKWTVDLKNKKCSGEVRIVVHYFEDGNVQLNQSKDIPFGALNVKGSDDKALGEAVREFARKNEADIQETLEEMYQNFSVETFKDMRRVLPISKTKMDWTGAQMKMASTMGKSKQ